jgi:hypothetical protein
MRLSICFAFTWRFLVPPIKTNPPRRKTWLRRFNSVGKDYIESYLSWFRSVEKHNEHTEQAWSELPTPNLTIWNWLRVNLLRGLLMRNIFPSNNN